jgi:hypothetical protein
MKTKYFIRFLNRAAQFDADLELSDVFCAAVISGQITSRDYLFDHVDQRKHIQLGNRRVTAHNRKITLNHFKGTLRAAFLKDIFEDVSEYLLELLSGAAEEGLSPERLIGENKFSVEVNDILVCRNFKSVCDLVAEQLFRKLENQRNTIKLLNEINTKLDLQVPEIAIQDALPYLELRHLLVHSDGKADDDFCRRFTSFGATPGKKIHLSYSLIDTARTKIIEMIKQYDDRAVSKRIIPNSDLRP